MNTKELVESVRFGLLEFDIHPISDSLIMEKLNQAYRFVYTHTVKSNDSMFAKFIPIQFTTGVGVYNLPKNLWGKRIEQLEVPSPPYAADNPWAWLSIDKVEVKRLHKYDSPRLKTWLPLAWAQAGNKIMIAPPPLNGYAARIIVTEALIPLSLHVGRIVEARGDRIQLDEANSDQLDENLAKTDANYFSVSDFQTGEHKCVFPYRSFQNNVLELTTTNKVTHIGYPVVSVTKYDLVAVGYSIPLSALQITKGPVNPASGSTVEVCAGTNSLTYENSITGRIVYEDAIDFYVSMTATEAATYIAAGQVFVFTNSPATLNLTLVDNIKAPGVDDSVSAGISVAKPITSDVFNTFYTNYAVLLIRSSLNENDPELLNSLKEAMLEVKSDTAGRQMGIVVERTFLQGPEYVRPLRRSR
jgi:hypothetical protein